MQNAVNVLPTPSDTVVMVVVGQSIGSIYNFFPFVQDHRRFAALATSSIALIPGEVPAIVFFIFKTIIKVVHVVCS